MVSHLATGSKWNTKHIETLGDWAAFLLNVFLILSSWTFLHNIVFVVLVYKLNYRKHLLYLIQLIYHHNNRSYGRYFISNTHLCTHTATHLVSLSLPPSLFFFFFCLSPLVKSIKMAAITSNLVPHDLFTRTADQVLIVGWLSKASVTERGPRDSSPRWKLRRVCWGRKGEGIKSWARIFKGSTDVKAFTKSCVLLS